MHEAPQVEARPRGPEREERGRRPAAAVGLRERALEGVGLEEPRGERRRLDVGVDHELAPPPPQATEAGRSFRHALQDSARRARRRSGTAAAPNAKFGSQSASATGSVPLSARKLPKESRA